MRSHSGFISKEQKEQILKATDIVQLIGNFVPLKPSGKNFLGLCPFHQEKTPSFTVSPSHQSYKCYGCGAYGDAIRFVMEMENLKFFEAVRYLADRAGIVVKIDNKGINDSLQRSEIEKCLDAANRFFSSNLSDAGKNSPIHDYLHRRLLSAQLVERFQLGFAKPGWTNLHSHLNQKGFSAKTQLDAGLIKKGDRGGYYDRLRDRLIFPIRDINHRIIGFAGRIIGQGEPKYLNPPETELYKKSSVFYCIFESQDQIRKKRRVIIVEGYLDAIRLHEQSFGETVATCGTALTLDHLNALRRFNVKEIFLLFDGDSAGMKAAEQSAKLFITNDFDSKVIVLPDQLDPDDYFKTHSNEDFQKLLDSAEYDYEFVLNRAFESASGFGMEHQKSVIEDSQQLAQNVKSDIKRELLLSKIAQLFRVDKRTLLVKKHQLTEEKTNSSNERNSVGKFAFSRDDLSQVKFIQYLISNPQCINQARNQVFPEDFANKSIEKLYARFLLLSDAEFMTLKPHEFPEIFVEHASLITALIHHKGEYQPPHDYKPRIAETAAFLDENGRPINEHPEEGLLNLISKVKDNKVKIEKKKLYQMSPDQCRSQVASFVERRKGANSKKRNLFPQKGNKSK